MLKNKIHICRWFKLFDIYIVLLTYIINVLQSSFIKVQEWEKVFII